MESMGYGEPDTKQYIEFLEGMGRLRTGDGESVRKSRRCCHRVSSKRVGLQRWLALVLLGFLSGCIAVFVYFVTHTVFDARAWVNRQVGYSTHSVVLQYVAYVGCCLALAAVAGFLVCYVEVLAAGSGIPEIKCFLNGIRVKDVVSLKTLVAKAVGISFSVGAGLPCGKEGPMIHSGAILGGYIARNHAFKRIFPLRLAEKQRDMVAAGAAAGVSAAFCAPVGGVLFAIEEGASHMNPEILLQLFVCCAVAALTSRTMLSGIEGELPWFMLGSRVPVEFGRFGTEELLYKVPDLMVFALVGVAGGVLGGSFVSLNKRLTLWRQRHIPPHGLYRFLEVLAVTFVISSLQFWLVILQTGAKVAMIEHTDESNPEDVAAPKPGSDEVPLTKALYWLPGSNAMKLLFHEESDFDLPWLLLFAFMNYLMACVTYGLGVPSGLFVPSLLTGAAFGRAFGQIMCSHFMDWLPWHSNVGCRVYALVGAVSFLSGTARITISLAVILMESTGDAVFGVPLFLATMCAKWVGATFGHGIYDMHIIEMKHVPLLEHLPPREAIALSVRDAMSRDVVAVEQVESVGRLVRIMGSCEHHGFPVLHPKTRQLAGVIERRTIRALLNFHRAYDVFQPPVGQLLDEAPVVPYGAAHWQLHKYPEYELQQEDEDKRVDLSPYVDRCGYSIAESASLMSCYRLFRQLGLRHLPVIDRAGNVCGIMTRKDLILAEDEHALKQHDPDVEVSSDADSSSDMDEDDDLEEQD